MNAQTSDQRLDHMALILKVLYYKILCTFSLFILNVNALEFLYQGCCILSVTYSHHFTNQEPKVWRCLRLGLGLKGLPVLN